MGAWILASAAMLIGGSVLLVCAIELATNWISRREFQRRLRGETPLSGKRPQA